MNLHPRLTRTQYKALRRAYRLARREDALEASVMPRLSSTYRRNAARVAHRRTDAIAAALDPWLVDTFSRRADLPVTSSLLGARLRAHATRRAHGATLARGIAASRAHAAQRAAA